MSVFCHLTNDVYSENTAFERKRLELYQEFLQLLLQLVDREEEEAQQLYQVFLDRCGGGVQLAEAFVTGLARRTLFG